VSSDFSQFISLKERRASRRSEGAGAGVGLTDAEKRGAIIGVLIAMFLAALDQTIVAPALPTIGQSLGDADFLPWVVSGYLLTSTATTPLYGKISDIYGRRPTLYLALAVFLVGSLACALAPSMTALIFLRALQGLGGGGLVALAQTVIADVASPRERANYVVYISTVWATSSVAGPVLGGLLAQHVSWTMIFWINLPIGALALMICQRTLSRLEQRRREHRLDILGAVLITAASVGLMLALTLRGNGMAWTSTPVLALLLSSAALAAWLIVHLRRAAEPLIPLDIFRNGVVGMATAAIFFSMFAYIGATVYLPIYFVSVMHVDATTAGAGLIVLMAGSVVGANTAGRLMPRLKHYKPMATFGLCAALAALIALFVFAPWLNFFEAEVLALILGVGMGPLFPTATVSVQNAVDVRDLGIATATLAFLRSFGGAIGVAALGAIIVAFGVVSPESVVVSGAGAAEAGEAFRWLFAAQALALAVCLACFVRMAELPLRGPSEMSGELAGEG